MSLEGFMNPDVFSDSMSKLKVMRTETRGSSEKSRFDDLDGGQQIPGRQIIGVRVRCGAILDAIGLIYADGDGPLYGNCSGGGEHRIMFEEGDSLRSISGVYGASYYGRAISRLRVETVNGKVYGTFGGSGGDNFCLKLPEDGIFVGFMGTASTTENHGFVESLGLIYAKGVDDAAKQIGDLAGKKLGNLL